MSQKAIVYVYTSTLKINKWNKTANIIVTKLPV